MQAAPLGKLSLGVVFSLSTFHLVAFVSHSLAISVRTDSTCVSEYDVLAIQGGSEKL